MKSDEFKKLLLTDASTNEGQDFIAAYYGIDNWVQLKEKGEHAGMIKDNADSYFYLLKSVKARSNKDNIWISFYEGLHRHAALMITLLSAVFNPTKNVFGHNSLTGNYFREQQLKYYKEDTKTPHKCLRDIFLKKINAPMLTKPFRIKCIVPKQRETTPTGNEVLEFTRKIIKYSELISECKKTSADNSTSSLLSKAMMNELSLCRKRDGVSENHALVMKNSFTFQVTTLRGKHESLMRANNNDDQRIYKWSDLLATPEWNNYVENPLDELVRVKFLDRLTEHKEDTLEAMRNPYPPYAISLKSMTLDVGTVTKGERKLDPRHYNAYDLIPRIVTILYAKATNKPMSSMIGDSTNTAIINFICRYGYATKTFNQNAVHGAVTTYLPELTSEIAYLNGCKGVYQVIPVAVFLMTLYNACFMFQTDKSVNMMIDTLQRFDLIPNLDNTTLLGTLSKWPNIKAL